MNIDQESPQEMYIRTHSRNQYISDMRELESNERILHDLIFSVPFGYREYMEYTCY